MVQAFRERIATVIQDTPAYQWPIDHHQTVRTVYPTGVYLVMFGRRYYNEDRKAWVDSYRDATEFSREVTAGVIAKTTGGVVVRGL